MLISVVCFRDSWWFLFPAPVSVVEGAWRLLTQEHWWHSSVLQCLCTSESSGGKCTAHEVFHKVCRLLHLTVAWAQRGVIKDSRAHPARQAAQGTGLTQWFSPALSAGYGGSLDQDIQGQARGSTHRLFWNVCVCNIWRETLPEFYIWICLLFPSSSQENSVISIGFPVSDGLFWSTELQGGPTCGCWGHRAVQLAEALLLQSPGWWCSITSPGHMFDLSQTS